MNLASYIADGRQSYGIITEGGVIDLGSRIGRDYADIKALLCAASLPGIAALATRHESDYAVEDIQFLPVIQNPGKILCIGLNYEEHRLETKRDSTRHPVVFMRCADSQVGHLQPMLRPPESEMFDYEGEIAVVIGKPGRRIPEADAWFHVAGYSCYNDGSVRDWQNHTPQWTPGKNFFRTGAFGPSLVTADEILPSQSLSISTRLNGQLMQHADTSMLIFSIPRLIAYCSTFLPLAAGDVIVTGTPGGVGAKRTPPVFMRDGDVVEVEVSRVGVLRNTIVSG